MRAADQHARTGRRLSGRAALAAAATAGGLLVGAAPSTATGAECGIRAKAITSGSSHSCALITDGTVRCWGANQFGQLGDGSTIYRSSPVPVAGLKNATAIAAGPYHTCAVTSDGAAWCWGANKGGQLGKPPKAKLPRPWSLEYATTPFRVPVADGFKAIAPGSTHTVGLTTSGAVYSWGATNWERWPSIPMPAPHRIAVGPADRIAAGGSNSCAHTKVGMRCWGTTLPELMGKGTSRSRPQPMKEADLLDPFVIGPVACGVDRQRTMICSGAPSDLGNGPDWAPNKWGEDRRIFRGRRVKGLTDVIGVDVGGAVCALRGDGSVACWGSNAHGRLGDGTEESRDRPVAVRDLPPVEQVAVGSTSTCGRTHDGQVFCWGENAYGQLGDGTVHSRRLPAKVTFCATKSEAVFQPPPPGVPLAIAIQRTRCYGACPVYSLRLYADGTVLYRGDTNVRVRGSQKVTVPRALVDGLSKKFLAARFLDLGEACPRGVSDHPSLGMFFRSGERTRFIHQYLGCGGPTQEVIEKLGAEVDAAVDVKQWTAGPQDDEWSSPYDEGTDEDDFNPRELEGAGSGKPLGASASGGHTRASAVRDILQHCTQHLGFTDAAKEIHEDDAQAAAQGRLLDRDLKVAALRQRSGIAFANVIQTVDGERAHVGIVELSFRECKDVEAAFEGVIDSDRQDLDRPTLTTFDTFRRDNSVVLLLTETAGHPRVRALLDSASSLMPRTDRCRRR